MLFAAAESLRDSGALRHLNDWLGGWPGASRCSHSPQRQGERAVGREGATHTGSFKQLACRSANQPTKDPQGLYPSFSIISELEKTSSDMVHEYHFANPWRPGCGSSREAGSGQGGESGRKVETERRGDGQSLEIPTLLNTVNTRVPPERLARSSGVGTVRFLSVAVIAKLPPEPSFQGVICSVWGDLVALRPWTRPHRDRVNAWSSRAGPSMLAVGAGDPPAHRGGKGW